MFQLNFNFELKSLLRNAWIQTLCLLLPALCLFAAYNGARKVAERQEGIARTQMQADSTFTVMLGVLDSVEKGLKTNLPPWQSPQNPNVIGNRYPRVAVMDVQPLALLATGQSDLYAHTVRPQLYGEATMLNFTELTSPVQLLFGSFDLSFVFVYLLPLIIIAFSYNILSAEKEQGSLRLLLSQPVSLVQWLFQKTLIRFLLLGTISVASLWLALGLVGVPVGAQAIKISSAALLLLVYMLCWFFIAALVNLAGRSSGQNAVVLLAVWVVLVLLLPAVVNQVANNLYPVPSRALLINELRMANADAEKQADTILASYYRDHPELMPEADKAETYIFYKKYLASQDLIRARIAPLLAQYETRLRAQQAFTDRLRLASPALLLSDGLNELAGVSSRHYQSYREQVVAFAGKWRTAFLPKIFKGEPMTRADIDVLPQFAYNAADVPLHYTANLALLFAYAVALALVALFVFKSIALERIFS